MLSFPRTISATAASIGLVLSGCDNKLPQAPKVPPQTPPATATRPYVPLEFTGAHCANYMAWKAFLAKHKGPVVVDRQFEDDVFKLAESEVRSTDQDIGFHPRHYNASTLLVHLRDVLSGTNRIENIMPEVQKHLASIPPADRSDFRATILADVEVLLASSEFMAFLASSGDFRVNCQDIACASVTCCVYRAPQFAHQTLTASFSLVIGVLFVPTACPSGQGHMWVRMSDVDIDPSIGPDVLVEGRIPLVEQTISLDSNRRSVVGVTLYSYLQPMNTDAWNSRNEELP